MVQSERLITDRLILRHFTLADAGRVQELCSNWNVASKLSRIPHPYPKGAAESWINGHDDGRANMAGFPYAICLGATLIGAISVETEEHHEGMEFGYWLGEPFWGNGFATEAGHRLVHFAFEELNLALLQAGFFVDNPASGHVLRKLGFRHTGEEKRSCLARGCEVSATVLQLTRQEAGF